MDKDKQNESFKVAISGPGVSMKKEVNPDIAGAILNLMLGGKINPPTPSNGATDSVKQPVSDGKALGRPLSAGEFLDECMAKNFPAKITAIGEFFHSTKGVQNFSQAEIKTELRAIRDVPKNFTRDFNIAIDNRWISNDSDERECFFVTKAGKNAVNNHFLKEKK